MNTIPSLCIASKDIVVFQSKEKDKLFIGFINGRHAYKGMSALDFLSQDLTQDELKYINMFKYGMHLFLAEDTRAIFAGKAFIFDKSQSALMEFLRGKYNGLVSAPIFMQYVINALSNDTEISEEMFNSLISMTSSTDKDVQKHALETLANLDYIKQHILAYSILSNAFTNSIPYGNKYSVNVRTMINILKTLKR